MENPGGPVGNEFDSITPCPGSGGFSVSGGAALGANLASGTYNLAILASDPGNWEGGAGLSNAPTIASYGNAINIDDTVPTISWGEHQQRLDQQHQRTVDRHRWPVRRQRRLVYRQRHGRCCNASLAATRTRSPPTSRARTR